MAVKIKKFKKNKFIEKQTLSTFKKEIPSQYFSHLKDKSEFFNHHNKITNLFRFGLMLPPEFFFGKKVIDLGSGTGDNSISLAKYGATMTLVEMNKDALEISKKVFLNFSPSFKKHSFINSSLYDINLNSLREKFDVSLSRGVFTHVGDKARAFKILASLAKPGGYVIYGDRNTYGGLQEMLQRYAIYYIIQKSTKKKIILENVYEEIVSIAEILFSEDIDRSQKAIPRTRRAIIFDRWVIQQQDDPTVNEVLKFIETEGLEYVNSFPSINFFGKGTSSLSKIKNLPALKEGGKINETLWMILNKGELENISSFEFLRDSNLFYKEINTFVKLMRNIKIDNNIPNNVLLKKIKNLKSLSKQTTKFKLVDRLKVFFIEIEEFLKILKLTTNPNIIRKKIDNFQILFKGYVGLRGVDYIAYKPKKKKNEFSSRHNVSSFSQ